MSEITGIKPFLCEDIDKAIIGPEWEKWLRALKLYLTVENLEKPVEKRNKLLHLGGVQLQEVAYSLPGAVIDNDDANAFNALVEKLTTFFSPKQNSTSERHKFRKTKPNDTENFNKFLLRIRHQAKRCDFGKSEQEAKDINLKDIIIDNWANSDLKKKILEKERTLDEVIELCQVFEQINSQSSVMNTNFPRILSETDNSLPVNKIKFHDKGKNDSCQRCGRTDHTTNVQFCPAKDLKCRRCGFQGHFAKFCKTRVSKRKPLPSREDDSDAKRFKYRGNKVNFIDNENENPEIDNLRNYECFNISSTDLNSTCTPDDVIECSISGIKLMFFIDSGCKVNIIKDADYKILSENNAIMWDMVPNPTEVLKPYASTESLKLIMRFVTAISLSNKKEIIASFFVVKNGDVSITGKDTAKQLGILRLGLSVNRIEVDNISPFPKIKDAVVKLAIDPNVKPVQQPVRRVPVAVEALVEEKLKTAQKLGIIEKVNEPSVWISPIVIAHKPSGDIRICVDMRRANEAIRRENYPIPTFDSFMTKLKNAKHFSRLDLKDAYHQLELDADSRHITTFITHKGLFRYVRLMFGVSSAPEIFQKIMEMILAGCENCANFLDEIIIFGSTENEHDESLKKVLSVLKEKNVTLNEDKCKYKVQELKFLGHNLSAKGISVDQKKVDTIMNFRAPNNKEELRSFLGLVTYVGKFIPDLGTATDTLRKLTKTDAKFDWTSEHEQHFVKLKRCLANLPTLSYFDLTKRTRLVADASPVALGAVLLQYDDESNPKVISFASKSLSDVERRYSQTEKESLALVWAVERFYYYLSGLEFELETDHKPLEAIFKPTSKPPARIERWLLRLQAFKFKVVYKPGKLNIADPLSRLCTFEKENSFDAEGEFHIFRVVEQNTPKALKISQIVSESQKDYAITDAVSKINNECWSTVDKNIYYTFRFELTTFGSILLRGNKIVMPESLRKQTLELAHEGHPGETVMKRRLRAKVWWPTIDKQTEQYVKSCRDCLLVSQPNKSSQMSRHRFPDGPWQCLALDLTGPVTNNEMVLVVIDYYSRYQEIKFLKSTTASVIVKYLNELFSRLGFPKSIRADNGPQFRGDEFKVFCEKNNIERILTIPYWPQANGEVENMNKSLKKRLKIAQSNGLNCHDEIQKFLLMYNVTPHGTTGKSPSELMFGRNIRDRIPSINDLVLDTVDEAAIDNDLVRKQKGKEREDAARGSRFSDICPGDKVLVQNMVIPNKLCSRFGKDEFEVVKRTGNEVLVMKDGKTYRRQVSHLKKIIGSPFNSTDDKQIEQPLLSPSPILNSEQDSTISSEWYNSVNENIENQAKAANENPAVIEDRKSCPSTPCKSCPSTPSTTRLTNPRDIKNQLLYSTLSPKVTPLKLKKKEGLWEPIGRP